MSTTVWRDLGTPESPSENFVELLVDGVPVSVPEGTSVLRAASEAGLSIPKLCATESLEAFGSCRLCLVEIEVGGDIPPPVLHQLNLGWLFGLKPTSLPRYAARLWNCIFRIIR